MSSGFLTNTNIHVTATSLTITLRVTVFLKSSNPWKNHVISTAVLSSSNSKIV